MEINLDEIVGIIFQRVFPGQGQIFQKKQLTRTTYWYVVQGKTLNAVISHVQGNLNLVLLHPVCIVNVPS